MRKYFKEQDAGHFTCIQVRLSYLTLPNIQVPVFLFFLHGPFPSLWNMISCICLNRIQKSDIVDLVEFSQSSPGSSIRLCSICSFPLKYVERRNIEPSTVIFAQNVTSALFCLGVNIRARESQVSEGPLALP